MSYKELSIMLKILADPSRLEILDLLSCGELCANDILKYFQFSQPTLSHHMKVLTDNNLVICRKDGNKQMYQVNNDGLSIIAQNINNIVTSQKNCICHDLKSGDLTS